MKVVFDINNITLDDFKKIENILDSSNAKYKKYTSLFNACTERLAEKELDKILKSHDIILSESVKAKFIDWLADDFQDETLWILDKKSIHEEVIKYLKSQAQIS